MRVIYKLSDIVIVVSEISKKKLKTKNSFADVNCQKIILFDLALTIMYTINF